MNKSNAPDKEPIRGWLIVIAILLWIGIFAGTLALFLWIQTHILLPETFIVLLASIACIPLLALFHRRKKVFVVWFLAWVATIPVRAIAEHFTDHLSVYRDLFYFIETIVIVLYILRSKRVKRTFVR